MGQAGMEAPPKTMKIADRVVNTLSPTDRDLAMVFQSYALYPHMSVADNIAYGLKIRRMDKAGGHGPGHRPRAPGVPDGRALSNLGAKLRVQMRSEIAQVQHDLNVTTIYVTHDRPRP